MLNKILKNYLRFWAKRYLSWRKPKIIAVTGSVGKTSTKDAIFEVLKAGFGETVRKSEGNLNTVFGLPLAVLGFNEPPIPLDGKASSFRWLPVLFGFPFKIFSNKKTKYLVLEIAADKPGDIKFMVSFIKPDIAVVTNIGPAHLEIFGSVENIIKEKTGIVDALKPGGWAIYNVDDENISLYRRSDLNVKTIAIKKPADFKANFIKTELSGIIPQTTFQVQAQSETFPVLLNTFGEVGNVYAALSAVACGKIFAEENTVIKNGLEKITHQKHRMEVFEGKNDSIIIDDSYNANPLSMRAALKTLKNLSDGRKIAVLGGMLELGEKSTEAHSLIGSYAIECADFTISIGELGKSFNAAKHFDSKADAQNYLLSEIRKGDIILVKASRGIGLEEVVETLKK